MPSNEKRTPVVIIFFCGAGGFTNGAISAGAKVVCGIDSDPSVAQTYTLPENNQNPDGTTPIFINKSVENLTKSDLAKHIKHRRKSWLIFVGCPPCQPFTNLKTSKDCSNESISALTNFVKFGIIFKPDAFIVENVPGIIQTKYGSCWNETLRILRNSGYNHDFGILNAKNFGVAQNRRRMILIAFKGKSFKFEELTDTKSETITVEEELRGLRPLKAGEVDLRDPLHRAASLSDINLFRIKSIKHPGGSRKDWPKELQLDCYKNHKGHTDVYGRMAWDRISPTLTTRFPSLSNGRFGHPDQNRAISLREGALLQSFPKEYQFLAQSVGKIAKHIGNAVPPKMACAIINFVLHKLG